MSAPPPPRLRFAQAVLPKEDIRSSPSLGRGRIGVVVPNNGHWVRPSLERGRGWVVPNNGDREKALIREGLLLHVSHWSRGARQRILVSGLMCVEGLGRAVT